MRPFLSVALLAVFVAGCIPRAAPPPTPARTPPPVPVTTVPPAPSPPPTASADWRDWPLTPGDWRYENGRASFGQTAPVLVLACDRANRRVTIRVAGSGATALTVRTTSTARALPAVADTAGLESGLAASDPLLDAMGFSRGRFVVERAGAPALVLPAYPEILRVAEDCRG